MLGTDETATTACDKKCCYYWEQCECEAHDESYRCNGGERRGSDPEPVCEGEEYASRGSPCDLPPTLREYETNWNGIEYNDKETIYLCDGCYEVQQSLSPHFMAG